MSRRQELRDWIRARRFEPRKLGIGVRQGSDQFLIAEIIGPLLRKDLQSDWLASPQQGAEATEAEADTVIADVSDVLASNVDGILYRLAGAAPEAATPMEYGGRYLEEDRRILEACTGCPVIVDVVGTAELYLDCLSDLPFDAWTWQETPNNPSPESARALKDVPFIPQSALNRLQEAIA